MGIAIGGGSISVAALVIAFVQWSLKRNVENEDIAKARLEARVESVEKKFEGRVEAMERSLGELRTQFVELKGEMRNLLSLTSELRGLMHEMKTSMEVTRDKQAAFYREELSKTEQLLRQDMTRAVQPELAGRVAALEDEVSELRRRRR